MKNIGRLEKIISNAYVLAMQVQDGDADQSLAEEVAGECAEFLALLSSDLGAFGDPDCMDAELVALVDELRG